VTSSPRLPEPEGLREAFWALQQRSPGTDVADAYADGPATLHADPDGLLVGHDEVAAALAARPLPDDGGRLTAAHVQTIDADHALVVSVTAPTHGGRGQRTQLWARTEDGWRVTAAHVSPPAPALDTRVWRVVGDPLVPGAPDGPLAGETLAVKDLYALAGHRRGAGNPAWLARAPVEKQHAVVVSSLLDAGADAVGITRTDELAWSLAGANHHHGTPPNPAAPGRLPGGSSNGSASAVALGHVSIGLGTDTGGSIRVPASYQGLFGIRTTHGAVPRDGLLPLAPSYDTVGWLTRDADLLARVGDVLLPPRPAPRSAELVLCRGLLAEADPEVAAVVEGWADRVGMVVREPFDTGALPAWRQAWSTVQAHEAWQAHGRWLERHLDDLGPDVRGRVEAAAALEPDDVRRATALAATARRRILELVGDRVLVLPAAATAAPRLGVGPAEVARVREATLRLTCLAGLAGLPAVTVPGRTASGLPAGTCLLAAPGRDHDLLDLVRRER
jgi:amidase